MGFPVLQCLLLQGSQRIEGVGWATCDALPLVCWLQQGYGLSWVCVVGNAMLGTLKEDSNQKMNGSCLGSLSHSARGQ